MTPGPDADIVLLAHLRECLERIHDYTAGERAKFDASRARRSDPQQTLAESSQRLSSEIKVTEPQVPWRELSGFRKVIVHGYLGVDLVAVWLVVEQDLPALTETLTCMAARRGGSS